MTVDDIEEVTTMRMQSWHDTYLKPEIGITDEWITEQQTRQTTASVHEDRVRRFVTGKTNGTLTGWVACDDMGRIVGATTPYVEADGTQRVGSLYIAKAWHGNGIGGELMRNVIDWFDPRKPIHLEVTTYNERAKTFYEKWSFVVVEGSERMHRDIMPVIKMIRRGGDQ